MEIVLNLSNSTKVSLGISQKENNRRISNIDYICIERDYIRIMEPDIVFQFEEEIGYWFCVNDETWWSAIDIIK